VAQHPIMEIISYNTSPGPGAPNNHILNSLLMKFFGGLFGSSAFVLRLPNLIAYLFFLVFSFLICKRLKNPIFIITGFLLMNIDPYLLEFFGLARGYGLANALMLGTIYFLLEWRDKKERKHLTLTFLFGCLSVLANFSLLQFYLGLFAVVNLIFISQQMNVVDKQKKGFKELFRKNRLPLLFTLSLGAIVYEPLRKIIKWHETSGGITGFWRDTAKSEIASYWGTQLYRLWLSPILEIVVILIAILIFAGILKSVLKKDWTSNASLFGLLFFIPMFIHIVEHFLFKNEFLTGRMAQYFVPLFILAFLFSADYIIGKFSFVITGIGACLGLLHLYNAANILYTTDWPFDCNNKAALEFINSTVSKNPSTQTQIGVDWILEPGMNFYRETKQMTWLDTITRQNVMEKEFGIYFVLASDTEMLQNRGKRILKKFPVNNTYVMQ